MKDQWAGVSKTAHFTAAVWHELGVPGAVRFVTRQGKFLRWVVDWGGAFLGLRGKYSVVNLFLTPRHLGLNILLRDRNPALIVELAAGLSSRGLEWVQTHPGKYLEIDQSALIAAKKRLLASFLPEFSNYKLIAADLLKDDLKKILNSQLLDETLKTSATAKELGGETPPLQDNFVCQDSYSVPSPQSSVLIICEGMTGYLGEKAQRQLLGAIRELAANFQDCTVLMDFYLRLDYKQHGRVYLAMLPARLLWWVLRAPMQMFLHDAQDIHTLLASESFEVVKLYSSQELAQKAGRIPPPLNLFYLAEFHVNYKNLLNINNFLMS
jgi:O-methyltransferase involved in polyketide biosynthesis